ncbi:hypothetical protein MIND_01428900 [Mycena indigotica]|uniref:Uncharacterized protein n=1 Tax=Mycena indigotica TaxID=2126181 RepID=A0A8H6RXC4_9AGAR|nr:uncharacterized protein MIND_01428900 [Mycena indigotica]KAF7288622.1 hypothetical protein MIND_01428900 [Mycena indigotica]
MHLRRLPVQRATGDSSFDCPQVNTVGQPVFSSTNTGSNGVAVATCTYGASSGEGVRGTCVYFNGVFSSGPDTCPFAPQSTSTEPPPTASTTSLPDAPSTPFTLPPASPSHSTTLAFSPSSTPTNAIASIHSLTSPSTISSASSSSHATLAISPSSSAVGSSPLPPGTIAGITVGALALAALSALLGFCLLRWRRRRHTTKISLDSAVGSVVPYVLEAVMSPRSQASFLLSPTDTTNATPPPTIVNRDGKGIGDTMVAAAALSPVPAQDGHGAENAALRERVRELELELDYSRLQEAEAEPPAYTPHSS